MVSKSLAENSKKGFALGVVSIIMLILGLMLITKVDTDPEVVKPQFEQTKQKQQKIKKALELYKKANADKYPCPASRSLKTGDGGFGDEEECNPVAPAACGDGLSLPPCLDTDPVVIAQFSGVGVKYFPDNGMIIGAVPTKALNLPDEYAFDEWGRRFVYGIDRSQAVDGSGTPSDIRIEDSNGVVIKYYSGGIKTTYALFSAGPNGIGAYSKEGSLYKPCASEGGIINSEEIENCNYLTTANAPEAAEFIFQSWMQDGVNYAYDDIPLDWAGSGSKTCPGNIAGCNLWLAADDTNADDVYFGDDPTNEPNDSSKLGEWLDKSASGRDATNASLANQPVLINTNPADLINNKPAVKFTKANAQSLQTQAANWGGEYTFFIVRKPNTLGGGANGFNCTLTVDDADHARLCSRDSTPNTGGSAYVALYPRYGALHQTIAPPFTNTTAIPEILTISFDGVKRGTTYKNGAVVTFQDRAAASPASTDDNILYISDPNELYDGLVSEVIGYPRGLSASDREQVECYLATKYGILVPHCYEHECPASSTCPAGVLACQLWYDSADAETMRTTQGALMSKMVAAQPGNEIAVWCDKSQNAKHASYVNKPPLLEADAGGAGKNAPDTSYTNGFFINDQDFSSRSMTLFYVYKPKESDIVAAFGLSTISRAPMYSNYSTMITQYKLDGQTIYIYAAEDRALTPSIIRPGEPSILTLRQNSGMSARFNGVEVVEASKQNTAAQYSGDSFGIAPSNVLEVIKYDGSLDNDQIKAVEQYLSSKWGIRTYYDSESSCSSYTSANCPTVVTGCSYWFDAQEAGSIIKDGIGPITDGDEVISWCDKSGNNRHATKLVSPKYETNSIGGHPSIKTIFNDSTNSYGSLLAPVANFPDGFTSIAIIKPVGSAPTTHNFILSDYSNYPSRYNHSLVWLGYKLYTYLGNDRASNTVTDIIIGQPYIVSYSGTKNLVADHLMHFNGKAGGFFETPNTYTNSSSFDSKVPLHIGANANANIGEIVYYPRKLDEAERKQIECDMAAKWGLLASMEAGYCP
jgi:hypothetical protein